MQRSLSAPSKLFLSGEYAVLWGGSARVAAVGPRATALVRRRNDTEVHLLQREGRCVGRATPLGVNWSTPVPEGFRFVARTVDLALRTVQRDVVGFSLAFSPSETAPNGQKLGFGTSSRAVVLAADAVRYVLEERWDPLRLALLAHWDAQNGKGSGADVAAIFAGGIIRYRRYDVKPLVGAALGARLGAMLLSAKPVDLVRISPSRFPMAYVSTGVSASTPNLIAQVEARWTEADRQRFVDASDAAGDALEQGLTRGPFSDVQSSTVALHEGLCSLGPLETASMKQALALTRSNGCAGKMSGAGGGDGCVLFAPDEETLAATLESLNSRGFFTLPLTPQPQGLKGEMEIDKTLLGWLSAG